jgi:hypothetical protein
MTETLLGWIVVAVLAAVVLVIVRIVREEGDR